MVRAKAPLNLRVVRIEPLDDEVGVRLVLGEDDRLADPVAACDPLPFVMRCARTLSTVSSLKSHAFSAADSTLSGIGSSSSHSRASHFSCSSAERSL